jgi:hypothetical protein
MLLLLFMRAPPIGSQSDESHILDGEALYFAYHEVFAKALVECQDLWYMRWFLGNTDLVPRSEWGRGTLWEMFEFKNLQYKIIHLSLSALDDPDETDIEWIGTVHIDHESGRLYSARTRSWESMKTKAHFATTLKKRAGQWYVMDSFLDFGLMPNLSCTEIDTLRKQRRQDR